MVGCVRHLRAGCSYDWFGNGVREREEMTDMQRKYHWNPSHVSLCTKDERLDRIYRDPSRAIYREKWTEERRFSLCTTRFWTLFDAREESNPIYPGDEGYEDAPYELAWAESLMGKTSLFTEPEIIRL